MLKIVKISEGLKNLYFVRYASGRHQYKLEKPIYYPKRSLREERKFPIQTAAVQARAESEYAVREKCSPRVLDYYKILGVQRTASPQDIKNAYYKLAKTYHPDAKPTPKETETFRKISEAYQVLSDENLRTQFENQDKFLAKNSKSIARKLNIMRFLKETPRTNVSMNPKVSIRGNLRNVQNQTPVEMKIKFNQAIKGCSEFITIETMDKCSRCNGIARLSTQANIEFCPRCGGTGQLRIRANGRTDLKVCNTCDGKRYVNRSTCNTCDSSGFLILQTKVKVDVPPGASTGDILKVKNPHTKQDIVIKLIVEKSNQFKREGINITSVKYLTISQAILGGRHKIRGLYEEFEVDIEPGIDSHTTRCFRGKGVRTSSGQVGDHLVTFKIQVPKVLTTKQRQLVLSFSKTEDPIFD